MSALQQIGLVGMEWVRGARGRALGALLVAVGLAACAGGAVPRPVEEGGRFGPGYPPGSAAWSAGARAAYRVAFMAGQQDEREGFRFDDDRGALVLEGEERGFYRQGYRRGYYHEQTLRRQERRAAAAAAAAEESGRGAAGAAAVPPTALPAVAADSGMKENQH